MLMNLGTASLLAGDRDESKALFEEALGIARDIDDRYALYCLLDALGCHAAGSGQARLAAQLLGAAETVRAGTGAGVIPFLAPLLAQAEESAITAVGRSKFQVEFDAGKGLSREAAIALALGEPAQVAAPAPGDGSGGLLGKREVEVAELVAEGLTNKQIGSRLFISAHTVDSHIRSIMNKLGCNSRAEIAAWMASSKR
jgi:DNA-binding CsgD family transcriptional regulator